MVPGSSGARVAKGIRGTRGTRANPVALVLQVVQAWFGAEPITGLWLTGKTTV